MNTLRRMWMCASKGGCLHRRSSRHFTSLQELKKKKKRRRRMGDEFLYEVFVVPFNYVWDPTNFNIHTFVISSYRYYTILYYKIVSCCEVVVCVFRTLCCEDFIYVRTWCLCWLISALSYLPCVTHVSWCSHYGYWSLRESFKCLLLWSWRLFR